MKGILAKKIGMTRTICSKTGNMVPVTILSVDEAEVLQVKTEKRDGYDAMVLAAFGRTKVRKNINKNYKFIQEVILDGGESIKKGDRVGVSTLDGVSAVKITSMSKGRGFTGVIKRYNFSRGPETHGSHHHREPGSVGSCTKPGRIRKGKKLPGHHGADMVTLRAVKIVSIDAEKGLIALKGAVPGAKGGFVFIREN